MGFKERISLIVDVDSKAGVSGLKSFGKSVREADGAVGKFKAGAGAAMDSVKANAGALAMAGGAALVAFGVKALGAFTDTAMGARDLSAATGLAVEDASRFIAVADDLGLSASDLTAGLGMVSKTLDDTKWDKYGIATRDASGQARDMNDILLDTFDVLSKETNLTERARLGKELLGKGYASLAPLIGKSRAEYEKMLGAVEDGQVITQKEAEKAQRMAAAQDALQDALNEVTLAVGSYVAELAPTIELMSAAVSEVTDLTDELGPLKTAFDAVLSPIGMATSLYGELTESQSITDKSLEELNKTLDEGNASAETRASALQSWHEANDKTTGSSNLLADAVDDVEAAADAAATKAQELADALDAQRDAALTAASSMWDVEEATLNANAKYDDYKASLVDGNTTLAELRQAQIDQVQGLTELAAKQVEAQGIDANSEAGTRAQITALQDMQSEYPLLRGEIQRYIDKLNAIPRNVKTTVGVSVPGSTASVGNVAWEAAGAIHRSPAIVGVGDAPGGEAVLNKPQVQDLVDWAGLQGGSGGGSTVVNVYPRVMPTAAELQALVVDYKRRNGGL